MKQKETEISLEVGIYDMAKTLLASSNYKYWQI
jgi:hypothetical protein